MLTTCIFGKESHHAEKGRHLIEPGTSFYSLLSISSSSFDQFPPEIRTAMAVLLVVASGEHTCIFDLKLLSPVFPSILRKQNLSLKVTKRIRLLSTRFFAFDQDRDPYLSVPECCLL